MARADEDDLCHASIAELAARIAAGALSPLELTEAYLDRIETLNPVLNTYITVTAAAARERARAAEREIAAEGPRSALHGVPLALKDIVDVAGLPTTCGSGVPGETPVRSAAVVEHLEAAGAILLGKLNLNEFATFLPSERFGPVRNPWHPGYSPGGSSSGSGAAVAAGLCAGALGTDTGGSIRLPATFCGITGLKATHGRVSNRGVTPLSWTLDHIGPMARSALDVSLIYDAIAGYDPDDLRAREGPRCSASALAPDELEDLSDLTVATAPGFMRALTDRHVAAALTDAVEVLAGLGAEVVEVELPGAEEAWAIAEPIIRAEAATWHARSLAETPEGYGAKVRTFLERAGTLSAQAYVQARGARTAFRRRLLAAVSRCDALVVPGALIPPPPLGARTVTVDGRETDILPAVVGATCPFNLTGQPALAVPAGTCPEGLPLGMQVVTRPWREDVALRLGQAFQHRTEWHLARPSRAAMLEGRGPAGA